MARHNLICSKMNSTFSRLSIEPYVSTCKIQVLTVVLHCSVFRATCLTTHCSIARPGVLHCAMILATATIEDLRESIERFNSNLILRKSSHKVYVCTHILYGMAVEHKPLRDKLHESLRGVLHWAMSEKIVTVAVDCSNEKIVRHIRCWICYTRQFFMQLVLQQNCETSCIKRCLV